MFLTQKDFFKVMFVSLASGDLPVQHLLPPRGAQPLEEGTQALGRAGRGQQDRAGAMVRRGRSGRARRGPPSPSDPVLGPPPRVPPAAPGRCAV